MKLPHPHIIIVTGTSGAGKSTALAAFEDAGLYCVDNMPILLVEKFLDEYKATQKNVTGFALGMDLRDSNFLDRCQSLTEELKAAGYPTQIVFLDAEDQVLLRRYNQTRRHHPMEIASSLTDAIAAEKALLTPIKSIAEHLIDTSHLSVHELKFAILSIAQQNNAILELTINIVSFGFKFGAPSQADLMIDVRFLDNPYFEPTLRSLDGESAEVVEFVLNTPQTGTFLSKYLDLMDFLLPLYKKEGKAYLTIAVGCTGGRHRSVVIAKKLFDHIKTSYDRTRLVHRDIAYH